MTSPLSRPAAPRHRFSRVALLFAGGPAPAANAVISTAAVSFLRNGVGVVGIRNGYSRLVDYDAEQRPLVEGRDYLAIDHAMLRRTRNRQGIMLGTARTNPGKAVTSPAHLDDPQRTAPLARVHAALRSIGADALISIGGDDTLKTANKLKLFQERLPAAERIPVVHLPKTIDNDYIGIDFTFGYFTAVDFIATEIRNLLHDAEATRAYFVAEVMGRRAGWLAYGAAIAGEASLVIGVEDIAGGYARETAETDPATGRTRTVIDMPRLTDRILDLIETREREGKEFGVIVLAEGLAELLPPEHIAGIPRDDHGHLSIAEIDLARLFAGRLAAAYTARTGRKRKVRGLQLGYESRCAQPHAFDVMLGSQLGVGAYRALAEEGLDGVMVSVSGQLQLHYVPFADLVDPRTLVTVVRHVDPASDFHRLARFLETYV